MRDLWISKCIDIFFMTTYCLAKTDACVYGWYYRKKTLQISQSVVKVEETLHGKRAEVDKLVKIRKLLQKLEFLSELPEKLDAMISAEQYTQAVELYNQTITVLAKHSNVLSFRNIHARTVEMMKDLRIKVLGLLDDTNSKSLDVVKLTEYVTTLRLMEAPSVDVIRMFLLAHKNRWNLVTTMYKTKLFELKSRHTGENSTISCEDAPELLLEMRKYHQNVVSGLMEACKGIYEMYHDKKGSTHTDDRTEAIQAHDDLQTMVRETMCAYTNVIVESVQLFVKSYNSFMREDGLNVVSTCIENKLTTVENSEIQTALQAYRDCRSDWMEQNASYAFLCRQLVLDVQYLDESVEEARCFPHELTSSLKTEHSDIVSRVLLELVVDPQMATAFHRHVDTYTTVVASSIPHFVQNCNLKREVAAESVAIMSCSLSHLATGNVGAAMEAMDAALKFEERNQLTQHRRVVIPDRTKSALHWRKALTNTYFSIFKSLAVELKSYYELVSVMNEEVTLDVPTVCYPKTAPASIDVSCSGIDDQGGAVNLTHIMSSYVSQIPRKTSNVCDVRYSEYYRDVFNITEASKAGAVVVLENGVSAMQCRFGYQLRSLGSMLKMYCESTVLRLELLAGLSARTLETQISTATGMGVNSDNSRLGGDWNCLVFDEEAEHAVVVYDKDTGLQSQVNEEQGDLDEYYKNMSQKLSKKSRQALGLDPDGSEAEDGLSVDDSTVSKICSGCNFTALVIHFLLSSLCSADDAVATESRSSHSSRPSRVIHEVSIDQFEAFLATIQDLEYPEAIIELLETDSGHLDAHCGSCMSLSSRRLLVHHNESCVAYMNQLLTHMPVYEYTRDTRDNDCCALHFIVSTIDCYNKEGVGLENPIGGSRLCDDSSRIEAFHRGESTVSDTLLDMMMILDVISCSVCILLGDAPPAMKSAPGMDRNNDQESDYSSRYYQSSNVSASTVGRRSSMQNTQSSIGLQLDIERLFSEKILIGNYSDIVEKPDNFGIMSCIVKVCTSN